MIPDELLSDLEGSIAFALSQHGFQPPRSRNPDERERYFRIVAKAVMRQIAHTWVPEEPDVLRRKPAQKLATSEWRPGGEGEVRTG